LLHILQTFIHQLLWYRGFIIKTPLIYHLDLPGFGGRPRFSLSTISWCRVGSPVIARSASKLELHPTSWTTRSPAFTGGRLYLKPSQLY
jgi:hypothetical protein